MNELLTALEDAWNAGSGSHFAASFAEDAYFVTIALDRLSGRQAIADRHAALFAGALRGSQLTAQLRGRRDLSYDIVVLDVDFLVISDERESTLTNALAVVERAGAGWQITAFHNMILVR